MSATGGHAKTQAPPLAPQQASIPTQSPARRSGRGRTFAPLIWLVAIVSGVAVLGGIVFAVYLYARRAGQTVTSGISIAERAQADITLENASRIEHAHFVETGRFTDDTGVLKSRMPNVSWERGSDPVRPGVVYVQLCDPIGLEVLLQLKTDRGTVFAMWKQGLSNSTYFALGPAACPNRDESGLPTSPWSESKDNAWAATVLGGSESGSEPIELPPPDGGPMPPNLPTPYDEPTYSPYEEPGSIPGGGGAGSNPYGGTGSSGSGYR